jgi:uncharacterized protein YbaP (TraB family)
MKRSTIYFNEKSNSNSNLNSHKRNKPQKTQPYLTLIHDDKKICITNPTVFRVSKAGKSFILLGTHHTLGINCFTLPVKEILLSTKKLIIERKNMDNPVDEFKNFVKGNKEKIFRKENEINLYNDLDDKIKQNIITVLNNFSIALREKGKDICDLKDPIIIGAFWGACMQLEDGKIIAETQLKNFFEKSKKPVQGLEESFELLLQILEFAQMALNYSLDDIPQIIQNFLKNKTRYKKMYARGDILNDIGSYNSWAIAERNSKWFPKILAEFEKSDNFLVAVGAGHLTNHTNGLLEWLYEKGFQLEKCDSAGNFSQFEFKKTKWLNI